MNMKKILVIIITLLFVGCFRDKEDNSVEIILPRNGTIYNGKVNIICEASKDLNGLSWSVNNKIVGKGKIIVYNPTEGKNIIQLKYNNEIKDEIVIENIFNKFETGSIKTKMLLSGENKIELSKGEYSIGIIREDQESEIIEMDIISEKSNMNIGQFEYYVASQARSLKINHNSIMRSIRRNADPMEKIFKVIDLENLYENDFIEIEAELKYRGEKCNIYIDKKYEIDEDKIKNIGEKTDQVILPRNEMLFGENTDVDGNGKVNILMTGYLNEVKIAVGFFLATDLFENGEENPNSNYQEILYTALPDNEMFSQRMIEATIAHEHQHLVNFSNKTYKYMERGERNPPMESLALNEGLSHLAEDLNGYNISGGNLFFVSKYLREPSKISLFYGEDSGERRGAFYLFLQYLLDKNGGIKYLGNGDIEENSGTVFLKNLINSREIGIRNIEKTVNKRIDELLREWVEYILKSKYDYQGIDKYTGEEYGINLNEDVFISADKTIEFDGIPNESEIVGMRGLSIGYKKVNIEKENGILEIKIDNKNSSRYRIVMYKEN